MKLSERFDRRYQQSPTIVPTPSNNNSAAPATVAPSVAPTTPPLPTAPTLPVAPPPSQVADQSAPLSPALAAAKAEIHAQLLAHHTSQIDINNRAGIRRLLLQLTEEHFRAKPSAAVVTAADKEKLVEILFDEVIGLGPSRRCCATPR